MLTRPTTLFPNIGLVVSTLRKHILGARYPNRHCSTSHQAQTIAAMLSDELFSSVCGPPIAANTAIAKDVGIYAHTLSPTWAIKASFKKSSAPVHCLALGDSHVYAAQDQKAHVHVYSRARGNQEALVPFQERIRCLALAGDVLVLGTAEGRLILWEVCFDFFSFFLSFPPLFTGSFSHEKC